MGLICYLNEFVRFLANVVLKNVFVFPRMK